MIAQTTFFGTITDDFLRSLFLDMFGDPARNPKDWPVLRMRDIVTLTQYGTAEKADADPCGVPVIRMNNITSDGCWNLKDIKYLKTDAKQYLLKVGDLLFNRTNSQELVGKTAVWTDPGTFAYAGYLIRIRFDPQMVSPFYVAAYLNSSFGKRLLLSVAQPSINMSNISASAFLRLPIPVPGLHVQIKFARAVTQCETLIARLLAASRQGAELAPSLSSLAFSGELIMNHAS
jgi:type I restriction enzyme, S subunit